MTVWLSETHVLASVAGLSRARLRAFVAAGCIAPEERAGAPVFAAADLARLELMCELAEDFELDAEALALVMSLIDQLHGLRGALRALAEAVEHEPPEVRARIRAALAAARAQG